MVDVTLDPALMLDIKSEIKGIPTINLTGEEAVLHYLPLKGNIAQDPKDNLDVPTTALGLPVINMLLMMNHSQV